MRRSLKELLLAMPEAGEDDDFARQEARREEVRALAALDGIDLADAEIMAGAWPEKVEPSQTTAQDPEGKPVP